MPDEAALVAFIRKHMRSAWSVELLLLLHASPARHWSPDDLVKELRGSTSLVQGCLKHFAATGLAMESAEGWHLCPADRERQEILNQLEKAYRERPMTTLALIRETDPVQSLADAFRIRGDENE